MQMIFRPDHTCDLGMQRRGRVNFQAGTWVYEQGALRVVISEESGSPKEFRLSVDLKKFTPLRG